MKQYWLKFHSPVRCGFMLAAIIIDSGVSVLCSVISILRTSYLYENRKWFCTRILVLEIFIPTIQAFSQLKLVYIKKNKNVKVKGLYSCSNYLQCILGNFQYSSIHNTHSFCDCWHYLEGIWNNYIDMQRKTMQVKYLCFVVPQDIIF